MKRLVIVARLILGLIFTVFSINFFVPFLPPPALPEAAAEFIAGMLATGYMLPLIKVIELVAGIMLLSGVMVPLALTLLAPIIVNIALFNFLLAPSGWWMGTLLLVLEIFLAWSYRAAFRGVLAVRTEAGVE